MFSRVLNGFKKPPPMSEFIKVGNHSKVGVVTIDRQNALNAINGDMFRTLYYVLRDLEKSKSHVIIKGAGDKAFSAGGDIKEVASMSLDFCKDVFQNMYRNYDLVATYRKPYIAVMDGITMGGASPFSIPGRYRIATERTVYAMPETAIGFINDAGASHFLPRLRNNFGVYLGMTGDRVTGIDVKKTGIATHYVLSDRLEELENVLLTCKTDEEIGKAISKFSSLQPPPETELDAILPHVDKCFDGDTVEEIHENLHHDGSDWAMATVRTLNKMSPTSMKVTHRSIIMGKKASLRDCLTVEFRLAINHVIRSDLKEGVRALLIDKDFKPTWNPSKLHDVTEEHIARFFQPLPDGKDVTFEER